jgi:hypothetical protein
MAMTYQIEFREEINTLISYVSPERPTDEELKHYLAEIIRVENIVIQNHSLYFYHIVVIEPRPYNLMDGMNLVQTVQQNKALHAAHKHLNIVILLVGVTSRSLQIMITMMIPSTVRRQVAVFPTLESALEFAQTDNAKHQPQSSKQGPVEC